MSQDNVLIVCRKQYSLPCNSMQSRCRHALYIYVPIVRVYVCVFIVGVVHLYACNYYINVALV